MFKFLKQFILLKLVFLLNQCNKNHELFVKKSKNIRDNTEILVFIFLVIFQDLKKRVSAWYFWPFLYQIWLKTCVFLIFFAKISDLFTFFPWRKRYVIVSKSISSDGLHQRVAVRIVSASHSKSRYRTAISNRNRSLQTISCFSRLYARLWNEKQDNLTDDTISRPGILH